MTKDRTAHVKMKNTQTRKHKDKHTNTQTAYVLLTEALSDQGQNGAGKDEKQTHTQTRKHKDKHTNTSKQTHKQFMFYSVGHYVTKDRTAHAGKDGKHKNMKKGKLMS